MQLSGELNRCECPVGEAPCNALVRLRCSSRIRSGLASALNAPDCEVHAVMGKLVTGVYYNWNQIASHLALPIINGQFSVQEAGKRV